MQRIYWGVLLLVIFMCAYPIVSQAQNVQVTIKITRVDWNGVGDGNGSAEPRFAFKYNGQGLQYTCFKYSGRGSGTQYPNSTLRTFNLPISNPSFSLEMDAFEKDKANSDDCYFNGSGVDKDDYHENGFSDPIDLYSIPPGVYGKNYSITTNHFTAYFDVRYWIIGSPNTVTPYTSSQICSGDPFTLSTSVNSVRTDGLRYIWEYQIQGDEYTTGNPDYYQCISDCNNSSWDSGMTYEDCENSCSYYPPTITVENWRSLQTTTDPSVTFTPNTLVSNGIQTNTSIRFRVRVVSPEGLVTTDQTTGFYGFSPPSPSVGSFSTLASCPNKPTGTLQLNNVVSLNGEYRIILTPRNTTPVDVDACINSGNCPTLYKSYLTSLSDITLTDLPPGEHLLWVTNPGGTIGICYKTYPITIDTHPTLALTASAQNVTCQGANDGKLTFAHSGGFGAIHFTISNTQGQTWNETADGTLSGLPPGFYTVTVTDDNCQQSNTNTTATFEITEPTRVTATIQTEGSQCIGSGNGKLMVQASLGSGSYNYQLLNTSTQNIIAEQSNQTNTWQLSTLSAGLYKLIIKDAARPACEGYETTFTISQPAPFVITNVISTNIDCNGSATGTIQVTGTGGIAEYRTFVLIRNGQEITNTSGIFENIQAGSYQVAIRSTIPGCSDQLIHPTSIVITQPTPIAIALAKTDIVCNGDKNGMVTATISGGQPGYTVTWEQKIGTEWNTVTSGTTQSETQLTEQNGGIYRVKVTDSKNCTSYSDAIEVLEPQPLAFASVEQIRPGCVSTQINLAVTITGGTPPYRTEYSPVSSNNFTVFTQETLIPVGSYKIRVFDSRNCQLDYQQTITVTENSLDIKVTNYPVCYKQTNGKIRLQVSGGFPPYQYSIDNGQTFSSSATFDNVASGTYAIFVKDSRGCSANTTATIIQRTDTPELNFSVSTRQNALDTLVLSEISIPKPDSVTWVFDEQAQIIDPNPKEPKIKFDKEGSYTIAMTGWFGGCEYTLTKVLQLQPFDPTVPPATQITNRPLSQFKVSPNPTTGKFVAEVSMLRKQQLVIVLYDMLGNEKYRKQWNDVKSVTEEITLVNPASGIYMIRAITNNDAREIKLVVSPTGQ
ncbi:T9SS type A sorting domain-containing protein [Cytophagaceae bacterium YF14B1]|uniref:T9SS type A sorting domain-containing protein n=1 Tax=Xanthocytophaga flava TaxID=3048013 RepID=A0AAE3QT26_9BACT|nr:T9SS type A sorting domain-containing protein [Xanthocytophaga flavus]MDJ1482960.1 T9SS type A sorting domain-containing protein [Xanthocytophaga flavus]